MIFFLHLIRMQIHVNLLDRSEVRLKSRVHLLSCYVLMRLKRLYLRLNFTFRVSGSQLCFAAITLVLRMYLYFQFLGRIHPIIMGIIIALSRYFGKQDQTRVGFVTT